MAVSDFKLSELLFNEKKQQQLKKDYADLKNILSAGGNASANAAKIIYDFADTSQNDTSLRGTKQSSL